MRRLTRFRQRPSVTAPSPTVTQASPGTSVVLGDATKLLCVIQAIDGRFLPYGVTDPEVDGGDDATSAIATGVSLYVDSAREWNFAAQGGVSASAACVPWSAFAGTSSAALGQYENAGGSADASDTSVTALPSPGDCFLSNLQGNFSDDGSAASVDGPGLVLASHGEGAAWAAAICFDTGRSVAFEDFAVDAQATAAFARIPDPQHALCGVDSVAAMNDGDSSITIRGDIALGNHSRTSVRCFEYAPEPDP